MQGHITEKFKAIAQQITNKKFKRHIYEINFLIFDFLILYLLPYRINREFQKV